MSKSWRANSHQVVKASITLRWQTNVVCPSSGMLRRASHLGHFLPTNPKPQSASEKASGRSELKDFCKTQPGWFRNVKVIKRKDRKNTTHWRRL